MLFLFSWSAVAQPFMFCHQIGNIAANQIAEKARLIWLYGDARLQVGSVADATAGGRGQIAVKRFVMRPR